MVAQRRGAGALAIHGRGEALAGKPLDARQLTAAAAAAVKDAAPIGKNEYKIALVRGVLEESLDRLRQA